MPAVPGLDVSVHDVKMRALSYVHVTQVGRKQIRMFYEILTS